MNKNANPYMSNTNTIKPFFLFLLVLMAWPLSAWAVPLVPLVPLAAGESHTCALTATTGVKCWGYNIAGQLGDGTTTNSDLPVDVVGLDSGVTALAAGGNHTCALTSTGGVKCWGFNRFGQLGNDATTNSNQPVDVVGLSSGVVALSAGHIHTCALINTGSVKCWGRNNSGQLGDGTTTQRNTPVDVMGLSDAVVAISTGGHHTCVITDVGGVRCWGFGSSGQLGNAESYGSLVPVDVTGLGSGVASIASGYEHTCALLKAGGVKCWGNNGSGQLGDGTTVNSSTPVVVVGSGMSVLAIAAGHFHSCMLVSAGIIQCWGGYDAPLNIGMVSVIAAGGYHTCVLLTDGGVQCWGRNNYGQLGNGMTANTVVLVNVIGSFFADADMDGIQNDADADDDNDGVSDGSDACPMDNTASAGNNDSDARCDFNDTDDDNDGTPDGMDPLPLQVKFNLNAGYKGSQVNDQQGVQ